MICFLCSKHLSKSDITNFNLLPSSVRKWASDTDKSRYTPAIRFSVPVHKKCAVKYQGVPILSSSPLVKRLTEDEQKHYKELCQNSTMLRHYLNKLHKVLAVQHNCCAICNGRLTNDTTVLRRKDTTKPRTWQNAEAVCSDCSKFLNWIDYQGRS